MKTVACQVLLSMRFSRQENWSALPFPSPGDLPYPGIEFVFPTLWVDSLSLSHLWILLSSVQFSSVTQSCPIMTSWTAAHQVSLSITNSQNLCKLISTDSVVPSNHLILYPPFLLPSVLPSIRVFSNQSFLHIRWPKYWSFSFSISPSNEHPGLISFRIDWMDTLQSNGFSRVFSNTTVQRHQFFGTQLSLYSDSHIHTWLLEKP